MDSLEPSMSKLGQGVIVDVRGKEIVVKAFPIVITGDMPVGADHSGFY
jgi:hypothetical protein